MRSTLWNLRRSVTAAAAAAALLTGLGCGAPQTLAPDMQAKSAGFSQALGAEEDEPGWKGAKEDLGHFFKVNDTLYRGQQPTDAGIGKLKDMGVKTVVYLHFSKKTAAHEKKVVEGQGMNFVHIPMSWITPPKKEQVAQWLKLTHDPAMQPVFVHCQHGKDRTGAMVGIYRIAHDGWTFDQAYGEMKEKGFRSILMGLTYGVKAYANQVAGQGEQPEVAEAMAF